MTEQMVVDAAIAVGVNDFTIADIADRLGTGMSAIYRVFPTREMIVHQAMAFLITRYEQPADHGQPWWDYVEEYAAYLFAILTEHRIRTIHFLEGGVSVRTQFEARVNNMQSLLNRGFSADEAFEVLQGMTVIVGGAAVMQMHLDLARENGSNHRLESIKMKADPAWSGQPRICELIDIFAQEERHTEWKSILRMYIRGIAIRRNEKIPDDYVYQVKS